MKHPNYILHQTAEETLAYVTIGKIAAERGERHRHLQLRMAYKLLGDTSYEGTEGS